MKLPSLNHSSDSRSGPTGKTFSVGVLLVLGLATLASAGPVPSEASGDDPLSSVPFTSTAALGTSSSAVPQNLTARRDPNPFSDLLTIPWDITFLGSTASGAISPQSSAAHRKWADFPMEAAKEFFAPTGLNILYANGEPSRSGRTYFHLGLSQSVADSNPNALKSNVGVRSKSAVRIEGSFQMIQQSRSAQSPFDGQLSLVLYQEKDGLIATNELTGQKTRHH
ncbi:hypothetical protein F5878DRAFT_609440 [Lentinula raphanica]|uniref:Uncharacterized protein n=1 Tax=Lentinula raphanica TaxID=153919 RepID=A0AA38UHA5_9AGAR|nr:hypothetical protein F5878DRAFT_609440 [Lentinula raphanica]